MYENQDWRSHRGAKKTQPKGWHVINAEISWVERKSRTKKKHMAVGSSRKLTGGNGEATGRGLETSKIKKGKGTVKPITTRGENKTAAEKRREKNSWRGKWWLEEKKSHVRREGQKSSARLWTQTWGGKGKIANKGKV